jgi:hypothetical protein
MSFGTTIAKISILLLIFDPLTAYSFDMSSERYRDSHPTIVSAGGKARTSSLDSLVIDASVGQSYGIGTSASSTYINYSGYWSNSVHKPIQFLPFLFLLLSD